MDNQLPSLPSRMHVLFVVCTAVVALWPACFAQQAVEQSPLVSQLEKPPELHESIVRTVRELIERSHVLRPEFNDEISARGYRTFLNRLDPEHLYFLEQDVLDFLPYSSKLDDEIREGKLTFAYFAYKRFLERIEQAMPIVHRQIDLDHDITVEESIATKASESGYAKDANELAERWRKAIKSQILASRSEKKSDDEIKATLHQDFRNFYRDRSRMTADELLEFYLTSITNAFDPHTNYRSPQSQEDFLRQQKLELRGIGATLRQVDGGTFVESLVPGGAAEIDGRIKVGDKIVAVGQEGGAAPVEIQNMKVAEVAGLIRGPVGTRVHIHVQSSGKDQIEVLELTRALISMESAAAKFEVIETANEGAGRRYRFGYIKLLGFYLDDEGAKSGKANYRSATRDLRAILDQLRQRMVDGIIIDLGRNDSGALAEAISATGLFIDQGPVVQVRAPDGKIEVLEDLDKGITWDGPLILKISQATTSASEVFAGAIQDYGRGLVVGAPQTHGKGTVQQIIDLSPEPLGGAHDTKHGALRLTIKKFFLPGGRSTQLDGVPSDVVLPSMNGAMPISEREMDYPLPSTRAAGVPFTRFAMVDDVMKRALQKKSELRLASDAANGIGSLSQPPASAERERTYVDCDYNREVLNIARDYVDELRERNRLQLR